MDFLSYEVGILAPIHLRSSADEEAAISTIPNYRAPEVHKGLALCSGPGEACRNGTVVSTVL